MGGKATDQHSHGSQSLCFWKSLLGFPCGEVRLDAGDVVVDDGRVRGELSVLVGSEGYSRIVWPCRHGADEAEGSQPSELPANNNVGTTRIRPDLKFRVLRSSQDFGSDALASKRIIMAPLQLFGFQGNTRTRIAQVRRSLSASAAQNFSLVPSCADCCRI